MSENLERQLRLLVDAVEQINERLDYLEKASHQIIRALKMLSEKSPD